MGAAGAGDGVQLAAIASYLEQTEGIDRDLIRREDALLMCRGRVVALCHGIPHALVSRRMGNLLDTGLIVRTPDVTVLDGSGGIRLVIEVDGAWHYKGRNREKTARRNREYRRHGVPYCVIDVRRFAEEGRSWFDFVSWHLGRGRQAAGRGGNGRRGPRAGGGGRRP